MENADVPRLIDFGVGWSAVPPTVEFAVSAFLTHAPRAFFVEGARLVIRTPRDFESFDRDAARSLMDQGVEIRMSDRIHAKVFVTQQGVYVGSGNLTRLGRGTPSGNIEAMAGPFPLTREYREELELLWRESRSLRIPANPTSAPKFFILSMSGDFGEFVIPQTWHDYTSGFGKRLKAGRHSTSLIDPDRPESRRLTNANKNFRNRLSRAGVLTSVPGRTGTGIYAVPSEAAHLVQNALSDTNIIAKEYRDRVLTKKLEADFIKRVTSEFHNLGESLIKLVGKDEVKEAARQRFWMSDTHDDPIQWRVIAYIDRDEEEDAMLSISRTIANPLLLEESIASATSAYRKELFVAMQRETSA